MLFLFLRLISHRVALAVDVLDSPTPELDRLEAVEVDRLEHRATRALQASPAPVVPGLCSNTCHYANDVDCDDGGPGYDYASCLVLCTDCTLLPKMHVH